MCTKLQYAVAGTFTKSTRDRAPFSSVEELTKLVPDMQQWEYIGDRGDNFVSFCKEKTLAIHTQWEATKAEKVKSKEQRQETAQALAKRVAEDVPEGSPSQKH